MVFFSTALNIAHGYLFPPQITTGEAYLVYTKRLHSNSQFNQYLSALYKVVGTFLFGAAVSQSLTDLAKFTIGRPRPNFLSVCAPVSCTGYMLHINCTGNARNVTESRWATPPLHLHLCLLSPHKIWHSESKALGFKLKVCTLEPIQNLWPFKIRLD